MGNPVSSDDVGVMCYNPAKSFQLARGGIGWYNESNYDTLVWDSGTSSKWAGRIIGIADYQKYLAPVVVKIESGGPDDLFVGFNRAKGINKDVADARDQVTVNRFSRKLSLRANLIVLSIGVVRIWT